HISSRRHRRQYASGCLTEWQRADLASVLLSFQAIRRTVQFAGFRRGNVATAHPLHLRHPMESHMKQHLALAAAAALALSGLTLAGCQSENTNDTSGGGMKRTNTTSSDMGSDRTGNASTA